MGFTAGGYNFEVAALSPKATRGNVTADVTSYVADSGGGFVSPAAAANALLGHIKQIDPDSIILFNTGNALKNPNVVTQLSTTRSTTNGWRRFLTAIMSDRSETA